MNRFEELKKKVKLLYKERHPGRADWADWLYEHHVLVATQYAEALAERYGANKELAMAGALLHDIADVMMKRQRAEHETKSWEIARNLLSESGFTGEEIAVVVDDAIRFHSCHEGSAPKTLEGKVVATADALAHLKTDFYGRAVRALAESGSEPPEKIRAWVLSKVERDFYAKILFKEAQDETRPYYEKVKALFSD